MKVDIAAAPLPSEILRRIRIFAHLNEAECRQLTDVSAIVYYEPGETIVRQGQTSQYLWIVLDGTCEVVKQLRPDVASEELVLAVLEPYNNFGEMSFFHVAPHSANVRAKTAVRLLRVERCDFDELIEEGSWAAYKLAFNAVESLAERLRKMDDWVARLVAESDDGQRVAEWTRFRDKLFSEWSL